MSIEEVLGLKNSSLELPELQPYSFLYSKDGHQIIIFPTLHDQIFFSKLGFQLIRDFKPDKVLLELPADLFGVLNQAILRLPIPTVVHDGQLDNHGDLTATPHPTHAYIVHPGEALYWMAYIAQQEGIPISFMDSWHPEAYSSWVLPLDVVTLAAIGWEKFWHESHNIVLQHLANPVHRQRSLLMRERLADELRGEKLLIVCGAAHWPSLHLLLKDRGYRCSYPDIISDDILEQYRRIEIDQFKAVARTWHLADIHPHTLHLVTSDLPYYLTKLVEDPDDFEYLESLRQLYFEAERRYNQQFDDNISPAAYQRLFQFLRNINRIQGKVLPDLYNLIAAAKGMADDDYAFEVYRVAISYAFLPTGDERLDDTIKFTPNPDQGEVIRFAFKRRFKRPIVQKVDQDEFDDLDPIPDEEFPGQWAEIWDTYSPYGYVSYPPEDEFIENYMQFLRKRIVEILMEEESSSMPFESSLEDGIDWRTTMRHFHEKKIYVKKYPKNKYQVGALIVQFLEEPFDTEEYGHHSTLFAEHDQESHISVITTEPGRILVGPGITRVKYAAIISQFPPVGFSYLIPKDNIDLKLRLIYTAMQMSLNNIIGFVAPRPPTPAQRHFAAEQGFRLVYLPMGQLTNASLHRLRTMHLLAHRSLRDNAREYIGF